jgi:type IV secretion system protein VirB10
MEQNENISTSEEFDSVDHLEAAPEEEISNKYQTELDAAVGGDQLESLARNNPNAPASAKPSEPEKPEVDNSLSKIASSNTGNIALIAVGIIIIAFIIYNSYKTSKEQSAPTDPAGINPTLNTITPPPASASDQMVQPQMPKLPESPEIQVPTVVPNANSVSTANNTLTPPSIPSVSGLGVPETPPVVNNNSTPPSLPAKAVPPSIISANLPPAAPSGAVITQSKANMAARYKTNMITFGGQVNSAGPGSAALLGNTSSQVTATTMGDLTKLIAQGKIIDGVLESAISTDLPGMVRAIVSRDTYAESGKNILIPKGSRLIGTYSAAVQNGQARVQITWTRMMRPDGVDIALASSSVDSVGRTGVVGNYEGRGLEQFTSALMVSALNYGMAALQDKQNQKEGVQTGGSVIFGGQTISNASVNNNNPNGSMVVTTNPTTQKSQALTTASGQISSIAQSLANSYYQVQPRITIDQGAKIKVFVQQDLVFPGQPYNSINVVN